MILLVLTFLTLGLFAGISYIIQEMQIPVTPEAVPAEPVQTRKQKLFRPNVERKEYFRTALPQASAIRDQFCSLRTSQKVHSYLEDMADRMEMEAPDLINCVENKFIDLDSQLFEYLSVFNEGEEFDHKKVVSEYNGKYEAIQSQVNELKHSRNEVQFLGNFAGLNEKLACYKDQVESSIKEYRNSYPTGWLTKNHARRRKAA